MTNSKKRRPIVRPGKSAPRKKAQPKGASQRSTGAAPQVEIRVITAMQTVPLRLAVLRPGRPVETAHFAGDEDRTTRHLGGLHDGRLVAVASLYRAQLPERPGESAIQLRGMATAPEARGMGLGRLLLEAAHEFARSRRARLLWCNARVTAAGFYQKLGFEILGGQFDIPDVGPHYRMFRVLGRERLR